MEYKCPACGEQIDAAALQKPAGFGGGQYCPFCDQRLYVSMPYGSLVALNSLLISAATLALLHVRNSLGFLFGTMLIWSPLSMIYGYTIATPLKI